MWVLVRTASINVLCKNKKNIDKNHLKMNIFTAVKYCCILHGRVCVMLLLLLEDLHAHHMPMHYADIFKGCKVICFFIFAQNIDCLLIHVRAAFIRRFKRVSTITVLEQT